MTPSEPSSPSRRVWVLTDTFDPGGHVVGVYDSKARAKEAADDYERHQVVQRQDDEPSDMRIDEHVINEAAR